MSKRRAFNLSVAAMMAFYFFIGLHQDKPISDVMISSMLCSVNLFFGCVDFK